MTATNHALTGAVIGLTIHNPWVAVPAALLSHVICDMIPHFGIQTDDWIARKAFRRYLVCDALLCIVLVGIIFFSGTPNWLLASVCAFVATSPDLLSISHFRNALTGRPRRSNALQTYLKKIQWFERPIGAVVEVAWAFAAISILRAIL
jgi:hypothetical protein